MKIHTTTCYRTTLILYLCLGLILLLFPARSTLALTTLPTLRPTADGTPDSANVSNENAETCDTVDCYLSVDDDPDSNDGATTFNGIAAKSADTQGYALTNMPADFDTMDAIQVDIATAKEGTRADDNLSLSAQVFTSGGTQLTDSVLVCTWDGTTDDCGTSYAVISKTLTITGANNNKTNWDDAQLRLSWAFTQNMGPDNISIRVSAFELDGTYNEATAEPTFTLNDYRWYVDSDSENVTDPWGVPDIAENTAITAIPAGNDPPGSTQELRLRVNFTVNTANLSASSQQFKLQFKAGTDADCTTGTWTDIGAAASSAWQFATSSVADGTTLTALKLAASDVLEVYAKANPTATNPNGATTGQDIEYDFHIIGSGSDFANATQYSFRVLESDGTVFDGYTTCPTLTTEPGTGNLLRHGNFFSSGSEQGFFWAD